MVKQMAECTYPRCYSCPFDYCIQENLVVKEKTMRDRREQYKEYYQKNKDRKHAYYLQKYTSKAQYVKYLDLVSCMANLKKQIGTNNYELIVTEFEKLNKVKLCDLKDKTSERKERSKNERVCNL